MKMKSFLIFWILLGIAIIITTANDFQLMPHAHVVVPDSAAANALFVCPAADAEFDAVAVQLAQFQRPLSIIFSFIVLLWVALLGWTIYQMLLKDKFDPKAWEFPMFLAKFLVFSFIIVTIILRSPNGFRRISIRGATTDWVLCESNSPGARAVRADAVQPIRK